MRFTPALADDEFRKPISGARRHAGDDGNRGAAPALTGTVPATSGASTTLMKGRARTIISFRLSVSDLLTIAHGAKIS